MSDHSAPLGVVCDGVPEVLKAVRTQLRRGADFIKICASGGVLSEIDHPIHQQFSDEELEALEDEPGRHEDGAGGGHRLGCLVVEVACLLYTSDAADE